MSAAPTLFTSQVRSHGPYKPYFLIYAIHTVKLPPARLACLRRLDASLFYTSLPYLSLTSMANRMLQDYISGMLLSEDRAVASHQLTLLLDHLWKASVN